MKLEIKCVCGSSEFGVSSNPVYNIYIKCFKCGNVTPFTKYMPLEVVLMIKKRIPRLNEVEEEELRKLQHERGLSFWQAYNEIKQGKLDRFF